MTTWQPIETAPKDGSYILALAKYENAPVVVSWRPRWSLSPTPRWVVSDTGLGSDIGLEQDLVDNDFIAWTPVPEIPDLVTDWQEFVDKLRQP